MKMQRSMLIAAAVAMWMAIAASRASAAAAAGGRRAGREQRRRAMSANSNGNGAVEAVTFDPASTRRVNESAPEPARKPRLRASRRRNKQHSSSAAPTSGKNVLRTIARAKFITERRYLKRDWCKSQPVRQIVRTRDGCKGAIVNRFCYGQCNSFHIPNDVTADAGAGDIRPNDDGAADYFKSCSFCKPKAEEWTTVKLRCRKPGGAGGVKMAPARFATRRIRRVKSCACIAVSERSLQQRHASAASNEVGAARTPAPRTLRTTPPAPRHDEKDARR